MNNHDVGVLEWHAVRDNDTHFFSLHDYLQNRLGERGIKLIPSIKQSTFNFNFEVI